LDANLAYRTFLNFLKELNEADETVVGITKTQSRLDNVVYMVVCNDSYFLRGTEKGNHIRKLSPEIVSSLGLDNSESDSP